MSGLMLKQKPPQLLLPPAQFHNIACASHLEHVLDTNDLRRSIYQTVCVLRHHSFDSIAFRGLSGSLIAPSVAIWMDKAMLAVRKTTADCHSARMVEGNAGAERYVIIDDLVSTGKTIKAIVEEVYGFAPQARCLGVVETMYLKDESHPFFSSVLKSVEDATEYAGIPAVPQFKKLSYLPASAGTVSSPKRGVARKDNDPLAGNQESNQGYLDRLPSPE